MVIINDVGLVLMTRKKPVETEVVEGAGASSRLVLVLKAETKSGYAGVTPNGKLWRARIYKSAKKQWDTVGTYALQTQPPLLVQAQAVSRSPD